MSNKKETIEKLLLVIGLLTSEANKYLYCLKPEIRFEFKGIVNNCISANERLLKQYEKDISEDLRDDLSEVFGNLIEKLSKEPTEKQIELLCLIKDWTEGNVTVID